MAIMQLKIEGKGNGIKTNIVNLDTIAKDLRVPTDYPLKFLAMEQGSSSIFKETGTGFTTVLMGQMTEPQLRESLDKYLIPL